MAWGKQNQIAILVKEMGQINRAMSSMRKATYGVVYIPHRLSPKCVSLVQTPSLEKATIIWKGPESACENRRILVGISLEILRGVVTKCQGHPVHKGGKREKRMFSFWVAKVEAVRLNLS